MNTQNLDKEPKNWLLLFLFPIILLVGYFIVMGTDSRNTLFIELNFLLNHLPPQFWSNATFFVDAGVLVALLGVCLLRKERLVFAALIGGVICGVAIRLLKIYFDVDRPPAVLNGSLFTIIGHPYQGNAFPSGHSATAFFAAALVVGFWQNKKAYVLAVAFALTGALSRIAVGVHWPTDVLIGGVIGWPIGYASALLFNNKCYFGYLRRGLVFLLCYVSAVALLAYDPNVPYVLWSQCLIVALGVFCSLYYLSFRILKV